MGDSTVNEPSGLSVSDNTNMVGSNQLPSEDITSEKTEAATSADTTVTESGANTALDDEENRDDLTEKNAQPSPASDLSTDIGDVDPTKDNGQENQNTQQNESQLEITEIHGCEDSETEDSGEATPPTASASSQGSIDEGNDSHKEDVGNDASHLPHPVSAEDQSGSEFNTEHIDPATISLPPSPFFNPFDNAVAPPNDSVDSIPSLDSEENVFKTKVESPAEREWKRQKAELGEKNKALDMTMAMFGLEDVKAAFLRVKTTIDAWRSRQGHLKRQDLNMVFLGNPGTGKRTLARLYYDFLRKCGVWGQDKHMSKFVEMTGHHLMNASRIESINENPEPGVISIMDADHVDDDHYALFLNILGKLPEGVIVVLSGSAENTPTVLGAAPEGKWLFSRRIHLKDYDDDVLQCRFIQLVRQDGLKIEGGWSGPYSRILARRVGRGREERGFGNMHELRSAYVKVLERQASRLQEEKAKLEHWVDTAPDETLLKGQDIIGPEPGDAREKSEAWKELQKMPGLDDVKAALDQLFDQAKANYRREILGLKPLQTSLNRIFMGPPGTGKTTAARLYGRALADMGLLSGSEEVVLKTPGDFLGEYIGEPEARTAAILDSTRGKVLIIDDAHMFYHGSRAGAGDESDDFRLGALDTLVSRVSGEPAADRCVLLLGYADRLEEMLLKANPGLRRRFPLEDAFRFADYDDARLRQILRLKMAEDEEGVAATEAALEVAAEVLRRARDRPNFGNGGDVVNLLNQAKRRQRDRAKREKEQRPEKSTNVSKGGDPHLHESPPIVLEPADFDPDHERGARATSRCRSYFDGLVGFDEVIARFEGYQRTAQNLRARGKDPREAIPFTYVFKGPPGTGKTQTAQIVGNLFYDMGLLSTPEVIACSATDLIGRYVGQTGPKVVNLFEQALGKVLFIDEAYRLGSGGGGRDRGNSDFAAEAVGEIVDCITRPRYHRKMIIVLAGYMRDMDQLMKTNAGLRGRFATEIKFSPLGPLHSLKHLRNLVEKQDIDLCSEPEPDQKEIETVMRLFLKLSMTKGWSNGRDVKTLADTITTHVYGSCMEQFEGGRPTINVASLIRFLKKMLRLRIKSGAA